MNNQTKLSPEPWVGYMSLVVSVALIAVAMAISAGLAKTIVGSKVSVTIIATAVYQIVFLMIVPFIYLVAREAFSETFDFTWPSSLRSGMIWALVFMGYVACLTAYLELSGRTGAVDAMLPYWKESQGLLRVLFVVNVVILAPLAEELFFRGYLFYGLFQSKGGPVAAAVISTLVWTMLHGQYLMPAILWPELIGLFTMGMILCAIRYKTKSIFLPIFLHGINNIMGVLALWSEA